MAPPKDQGARKLGPCDSCKGVRYLNRPHNCLKEKSKLEKQPKEEAKALKKHQNVNDKLKKKEKKLAAGAHAAAKSGSK